MRIGKFYLPIELIKDEDSFDTVREILGETVIVRAECLYAQGRIEYTAICQHFDLVPEGSIVPEYDVMISSDKAKFSFKRI